MNRAIPLRTDFSSEDLRLLSRKSQNADQARRLLALASIYDGGTRQEAAHLGHVTVQIIRDWVIRFNAEGPDGLLSKKHTGRPSILNDEHRRALEEIIEQGPIPAIHTVVRWRICDLIQWLWEEHRVSIGKSALSNELRKMGYRKLSARPCHRQRNEEANEAFKKTSPPKSQKSSNKKHKAKT